ncbi:MAG: flagellar L-ring protein FlgH [Sphingomonadales bacterium]|jgi:flagellar L-ring protein precursor FlgH|nr:flagellar L-ring protein FlgH [Sphingomonadales bacterium]
MSRQLALRASCVAIALVLPSAATCENLYRNGGWPAMSADRRAAAVGDAVTVVIFETAEAVNSTQSSTRRATDVGGRIHAGPIGEEADISFGGGFTGRGEVRRSDRVVARITVTVEEVLANGDFVVAGDQWLYINRERTRIGLRGRIRQADISSDNIVLSSRIADAEIDYDGRGFVSRSARPGLVTRIFRLLGLS